MTSTLESVFTSYQTVNIDLECLKSVGVALSQCSQNEYETFFDSYQPTEVHLQLLKIIAAKGAGYLNLLIHGLKGQSKDISKLCIDSKVLYQSSESPMFDPEYLIPLLQAVSRSARNRIIWNLGKYKQERHSESVEILFDSITKIWGFSSALPLLCHVHEDVIQQQLKPSCPLSKSQLMTIAKRFPFLALRYLEKYYVRSRRSYSVKAAKYIVYKTIPKSFDFCLKHEECMSRSTIKHLLSHKYSNIVLENPLKWANILDPKVVYKAFPPDTYEIFLEKQMSAIINDHSYGSDNIMLSYFKLLPAHKISSVVKRAFGANFDSNLDFWKNNRSILELLDSPDRNHIACILHETYKDLEWVALMTVDTSIPLLKEELRLETNADARANLITKLLETVQVNKVTLELEELCKLVATRYRNDNVTLHSFFRDLPDMSKVNTETWSILFPLAHKYFNPDDWKTRVAVKLYSAAVKRNAQKYLSLYIKQKLAHNLYELDVHDDLAKLDPSLRNECIQLALKEPGQNDGFIDFLTLISNWNSASSEPLVNPALNSFILEKLKSDNCYNECFIDFVINKSNGLDISFIEKCFVVAPEIKFVKYFMAMHLPILSLKEVKNDLTEKIIKHGCDNIPLLKKLRNWGYVELLQYLTIKCKDSLDDLLESNYKNAFPVLSLTVASSEYFDIIDPYLPTVQNQETALTPLTIPEESERDVQTELLEDSKREIAIYSGIGISLSHICEPALTIDRLMKFCVSSDLVLYVRDALCSVCSSLPNAEAHKIVLSLMQRPISVKKHALRIHSVICNIKTQQELFLSVLELETHITSRTVLLQSALTCLNNTKSDSMWLVTKEMIKRVTDTDKSIILLLVDAEVTDDYLEPFVDLLLEKCKLLEAVKVELISKTLGRVCSKHSVFSKQFLEKIFNEYFLSELFYKSLNLHDPVSKLCCICVKNSLAPFTELSISKIDLVHQLKFFVDKLNATVTEISIDKYDADLGFFPIRKLLTSTLDTVCCELKEDLLPNLVLLPMIIEIIIDFLKKFDKHTFFTSVVFMELTSMAMINKECADSFGHSIGRYCDKMTQQHPDLSYYILPKLVAKYCNRFSNDSTNCLIPIMNGILQDQLSNDKPALPRLMAVAYMLPDDWQTNKSLASFAKSFMDIVKNTPIEIYLFI